ncbi:isoaspartyl peptidase/L-asparaginase [Haloarchaeobius iranensis]|uniref:Plant-type L-asparaginase n=1 Tax=Haloarchaeobius iranensis TaxID=996166 RepID=A0A1H0A094_9EURY|nr:isoaspartyl peptidase/L-asparaginase [Haloarchaeobius iranensis]SDN26561.1 asparaginase [Haloarchaeobius iranensis]
MQVIVHGGAGGVPDDPDPRQAVLDEAAGRGASAATPLDAVESAVRVLESSPRFNAGVGSCAQSDGILRTDAGVMTDDRSVGAASSMPGVEAAVSVARSVLEETPHILLSGVHAVDFAAAQDIDCEVDLWTDSTRERFADADVPEGDMAAQARWVQETFGGATADPDAEQEDAGAPAGKDHDTVGAVARDGENFAAATSTGGRWLALAGRVGDVPQVGSGFYCSPAGGASATGAGEDIARVTLSRRAVRYLEDGMDAQAAADRAIDELGELTGSSAGIIVADSDGTGAAFNSDGMQTAVVRN